MSLVLAAQQTALLDLLDINDIDLIALDAVHTPASGSFFLKQSVSTLRGLRAYRANAQALSKSVLASAFPTLQQLLGAENFQNLAQNFWAEMPPERGDLAQWGGELAAFLSQVPQLQVLLDEHPFLPDVARVEWALHTAATANDALLDAKSFEWLTSTDPAELRLHLSPGCAVVCSAYPVVAVVQLHDARMSNLHEAAREAIANNEAQNALIWRRGFRPMLGSVDAASHSFIKATLRSESLAFALREALAQTPDFDFSAWLSASVQSGLVMGAASLDVAE